MSTRSTLLLEHHLKELKLPTFLREYRKLATQCAAEGADHPDYLLRLAELELIDRHQRMVQRRIRAAHFPATKSLDTFDFLAIPSLNKPLVMQLARCEYIERRENVIAIGNSGTGKTHVALGLGLAACQRGMSVGFTTAAALVHELMEARDDRRLLNLQRQLARLNLLIIDELGFVPLSTTGAELLFEVFSQRYERGSILVTTNLPFDEWTEVFGSERLTGALLDRLTHHVHILEMNGDSYRLKGSRQSAAALDSAANRCEWCRAENGQPHPDTGSDVVLTLDHVWDKRPENASLLNLAALYQRCHNRWDARDRLDSRLRRRIVGLMRQGQIPLCLSPVDSLAMALYDELVRQGMIGMPPQRTFLMAFPAAAWEWASAG